MQQIEFFIRKQVENSCKYPALDGTIELTEKMANVLLHSLYRLLNGWAVGGSEKRNMEFAIDFSVYSRPKSQNWTTSRPKKMTT